MIVEFLVEERGVRFEGGRIEKDIDAVIYCTGYLYSYPFLKMLDPPIITTGHRVAGLYRQIFNIVYPTLAFTALQKKIIPFPLSEVQAAAIAKVWTNKLYLPEREEMLLLEKKQLEEQGDGTDFHVRESNLYHQTMSQEQKYIKNYSRILKFPHFFQFYECQASNTNQMFVKWVIPRMRNIPMNFMIG
jgi:hypothetical protein